MCIRDRYLFDCGHASIETAWGDCTKLDQHHHRYTTYTNYIVLCPTCQRRQDGQQLVFADDNDSTFTNHSSHSGGSAQSGNSYYTPSHGHYHRRDDDLRVHVNVRHRNRHGSSSSHVRVRSGSYWR